MSFVGNRSDRDVMLSRLGITDDASLKEPPPPPPERTEGPRLSVVAPVEEVVEEPAVVDEPAAVAEVAADDPLDDILSRFGIDEKPARKVRQAAEPAPRPVLRPVEPEPVAEFEIPEPPAADEPVVLRNPEWVAEPVQARAPEPVVEPEPQPVVEPAPEPVLDPEVRRSLSQAEELEELRRQLRSRNRTAVPSELPGVSPVAAVAAVAAAVVPASPPKGVKRRKNGELSNVRIVIWLVVIGVCGWLTYTVVKASVEHDKAQAKPAVVQTIEQAKDAQRS